MAILEEVEVEKQEEDEQSTDVVVVNDPSSNKTKNRHLSFPVEIIEDILLRLPVESILRSTSVSKQWYSLISHPSFSRLQFTRATLALFFSAYDSDTHKRHYFSASALGGPLTLLLTVDKDVEYDSPSHLNGLVCFTCRTKVLDFTQVFVVNPSTRRVFKLPRNNVHCRYLYGFDESRNQHKILLIKTYPLPMEYMVFDMLSRSWRKIDVELPVGITWGVILMDLDGGICLNSKVHILLDDAGTQLFQILAFDFVTEKFSLMSIPQDVWRHIWVTGKVGGARYRPFLVKISSGCLGFVINDDMRGKIYIWLLQDYQNSVWVKDTITLPEPWNVLARDFHLSIDANMDDDIVFIIGKVSDNVMIVLVYNRKSKCFRSLEFTVDGQFLYSETLRFHHIMHYVDSIVPV